MGIHIKPVDFLLLLTTSIIFNTAAKAREVQVNGLPCNELCQSWMKSGIAEKIGKGFIREIRPYEKTSIHKNKSIALFYVSKHQRSKVEAVKAVPLAQTTYHLAPENIKTRAAAKHSLSIFREAQSRIPVPSLRNAAIPRSSSLHHNFVEVAPTPDAGRMPLLTNSKAPAPIPDQSATSPSQVTIPNTAVTATSPTASQSFEKSDLGTFGSSDKSPKTAIDASEELPTTIGINNDNKLHNQSEDVSVTPKSPSTDVVASISAPVNAGNGSREDDRPSGNLQQSILQPIPELAGKPLPVTVGQINVEPRGTDVHVVLVNILQQEIKDVDVMCRARDEQGIQVAEAYAHIASIAPFDVAFGQVLFLNEIKMSDSKITCESGKIENISNVMR